MRVAINTGSFWHGADMTTEEMISAGHATWVLPLWGPDGSQQFVTPAEAAATSFDHFRAGVHARQNPDVAWGLMYAARYAATGEEPCRNTALALGVPENVIDELIEVGIPVAWLEPLEMLPREVDEQWRTDPGTSDMSASTRHQTKWVVRSSVAMWVRDGLHVPANLMKYVSPHTQNPVDQAPRDRERTSSRRTVRQLAGSDSDPPRLPSRVVGYVLRAIGVVG